MLNGFGVSHGGIVFSLADSALAFASNTNGHVTVSVDNTISYPAPVELNDELIAVAEEESAGERLAFYRVTVARQGRHLRGSHARQPCIARKEKHHPSRVMSTDAYIVDGVRTAVGSIGGQLSEVRADDMAAHVIAQLMSRHSSLDPGRNHRCRPRLRESSGGGQPQRGAHGAAYSRACPCRCQARR